MPKHSHQMHQNTPLDARALPTYILATRASRHCLEKTASPPASLDQAPLLRKSQSSYREHLFLRQGLAEASASSSTPSASLLDGRHQTGRRSETLASAPAASPGVTASCSSCRTFR